MDFPARFRTRRLLFTRIERGDLDDFLRMRSDPQVMRMLGGTEPKRAAALVDELALHWDRHGYGWWIARDPDSGRFLGCGGLRSVTIRGVPETEVAYGFLPEYWGRGYATELARVAVAQGFVRLGLRNIVSFALRGNQASRRVMEKTGFAYERELVHSGRSHVLYRLTVEAWRTAPLERAAFQPREMAVLQSV
jgi:RimJ/RimL family protein N-acetyltransferase